jgi:3-methyladenine DNA glycosylase AlkD
MSHDPLDDLLSGVRIELERNASPEVRASQLRFHKPNQHPPSYGIMAPKLRDMARDLYPAVKKLTVPERDRFCTALWENGSFEEGAIVCYIYRRFAKRCGEREFRLFTRWLDRYVHNWGHTDAISLWLFGACVANDPALIEALDAWTKSKNRWKRRGAAVSLVYEGRRGRNTDSILRIADLLLGDADDMVQKGVGWLLKETYPSKPAPVMRFLMPRREKTTRLVLRYAAEKMSTEDRARLLD